jgi:hypothetical protein
VKKSIKVEVETNKKRYQGVEMKMKIIIITMSSPLLCSTLLTCAVLYCAELLPSCRLAHMYSNG